MALSNQQKRILRWVGYPVLGVCCFLYALHLTFPYERIKDKLVEALSDRYEMEVSSVERTILPGGMILNGVALRSRPADPAEPPAVVFINKIRIKLSLLALLGQTADVEIVMEIGGGVIEGNVTATAAEVTVDVFTEGLPLDNIPGLAEAIGLPMKGGLNAKFSLTLPEMHWDQADGMVSLSCPGCTVGDGKAQIKPPQSSGGSRSLAFASGGITVPELNLGDIKGEVVVEDGRAKIEKFAATSKDGELELVAAIRFEQVLKNSQIESGCMRFKLSEDLKQRDPKFGAMPNLMRVSGDVDDYAYLKMKGTLGRMRWLATAQCDTGSGAADAGDDGDSDGRARRRRIRPTLTQTGDDEPANPSPPRPGFGTKLEPAGETATRPETLEPSTQAPDPDIGDVDDAPEMSKNPRLRALRRRDDVGLVIDDDADQPGGNATREGDHRRLDDDDRRNDDDDDGDDRLGNRNEDEDDNRDLDEDEGNRREFDGDNRFDDGDEGDGTEDE